MYIVSVAREEARAPPGGGARPRVLESVQRHTGVPEGAD